jgi:outer membrane protein assembly factor BamB
MFNSPIRGVGITLAVVGLVVTGTVSSAAGTPQAPRSVTSGAVAADASPISISLAWERHFDYRPDTSGSPGVAVLDDAGPSVIIGGTGGTVVALHASDGEMVAGWPGTSGGAGILSTPSTIGEKEATRILIGVGNSNDRTHGGYLGLDYAGNKVFYRTIHDLPNGRGSLRGVMSSIAIGNLHYGTDGVGGAMGQMQLAFNSQTGRTIPGFPWLQADTNFSTPAVAKIRSTVATDYIIEGGDSTRGVSEYKNYGSGGHIRILRATGYKGHPHHNDGLLCELKTNQVVQSSPAVGKFLSGGATIGVVTGTGTHFKSRSDTNRIIAMDTRCTKKWTRVLDGNTLSSPALADLTGDGSLEVVTASGRGSVYALDGSTGAVIWKQALGIITYGSVTTFQSPTGNFQYVLAPTQSGLYVLDGRDGSIVDMLGNFRLHSSATVTADPDGSIGITIAGAAYKGGSLTMIVQHYTVDGSSVETVQTPGAWPMFHHDPQLTGYASDFVPGTS